MHFNLLLTGPPRVGKTIHITHQNRDQLVGRVVGWLSEVLAGD